jgi:uncharacterized membrane protein
MHIFLEVLKGLLGLFVILFAPGYSFLAALFPRAADLDAKERLGLSFVLSVAISSPMVWILDKFPGGLNTAPVAIAFTGFVVGCTAIAAYRRRRLPQGERRAIHFLTRRTAGAAVQLSPKQGLALAQATSRSLWRAGIDLAALTRTWWRRPWSGKGRPWAPCRWARRYWVVGLILGIAVAGTVVMTSSPAPEDGNTEFYLLGIHGSAEDYPREALVGQPVNTVFGISNREGEQRLYRVEVYQDEARIGAAGPYRLEDGEVLEATLTFTPIFSGEDARVKFFLLKDGGTQPYRLLELWVRVKNQD